MIFACWCWCIKKPRKLPYEEKDTEPHLSKFKLFSLQELQVATETFSNEYILGKPGSESGSFGRVYKGILEDGSLVAIRRLKSKNSPDGEIRFQKVMVMNSMAVHQNLLKLKGLCITPTERILVYPYMANGSVASKLRDRPPSEPPLDWLTRKRIALGSANALSYLHEICNPRIIHCDVKASNIFLDDAFEAIIGDFSLAELIDSKDTHTVTIVHGTFGHIAPEYLSNGRCSEKCDVYSYGIMLLELITGQKTVDLSRLSGVSDIIMLLDLVKKFERENKLEMIVDPDIQNNYVEAEMEQLIQVALFCTQGSPEYRPKMSEVVRMVECVGLTDRWDEWQKMVISHQELGHLSLKPTTAVFDSTLNLPTDELSGPR